VIDKRRTKIQYQHGECHRVGIIPEGSDQVNQDANQSPKNQSAFIGYGGADGIGNDEKGGKHGCAAEQVEQRATATL